MAVFHDGNAVADAHGFVEVMRNEDDGAALDLLQTQQFRLHFRTDNRIERGKRFIHQQDRWIAGQRTGQAHALLHAARQFVGIAGAVAVQAYLLQRLLGQRMALGLGHAGQFHAEGSVV